MASIVMISEIALAMGLCVPVLMPLACCCCAAHAVVFQHSSLPLKYDFKPSTGYLWVSLGLGYVLIAWLFHEGNLSGAWLVIVGPPLAATCAALASRATCCRAWWLRQMEEVKEEVNTIQMDLNPIGEPSMVVARESNKKDMVPSNSVNNNNTVVVI